MNEMGLKEKAAMAVIGVVLLFAIAVVLWFTTCESQWKRAAKAYDRETQRYAKEERLISERRKWNELYEDARSAMPTFAYGQQTDTTWLRKVEDVAKTNRVLITQIDAGKEVEAGEVLELPIEVRSFEASLEALVKFIYALESSTEGMFDVGEISLKPSSKKGYLKGSLSLTCAYMRGEVEAAEPKVEPKEEGK